jgi:hypothetical protein
MKLTKIINCLFFFILATGQYARSFTINGPEPQTALVTFSNDGFFNEKPAAASATVPVPRHLEELEHEEGKGLLVPLRRNTRKVNNDGIQYDDFGGYISQTGTREIFAVAAGIEQVYTALVFEEEASALIAHQKRPVDNSYICLKPMQWLPPGISYSPHTQSSVCAVSSNNPPFHDLMIRAALGETIERTPVWLFRQGGRHLPEFNEYQEKVGRTVLEMLQIPEVRQSSSASQY